MTTITATSLTGLTKTNLREQALASLRTAITSGQIPPESQMVETELSDQLGISRGTLREAMRQLQQEGLLVAQSRGRLFVRRLGPKEIGDIFAVRAALEALAASRLAGNEERTQIVAELRALLAAHGPGDRRRQPGAAHRVRPRLPPRPVPADRQRIAPPHLGGPRRIDPHVDHVRRPRPGRRQHGRRAARRHRRRHRIRRSRRRRPLRCRNTWPGRPATSPRSGAYSPGGGAMAKPDWSVHGC